MTSYTVIAKPTRRRLYRHKIIAWYILLCYSNPLCRPKHSHQTETEKNTTQAHKKNITIWAGCALRSVLIPRCQTFRFFIGKKRYIQDDTHPKWSLKIKKSKCTSTKCQLLKPLSNKAYIVLSQINALGLWMRKQQHDWLNCTYTCRSLQIQMLCVKLLYIDMQNICSYILGPSSTLQCSRVSATQQKQAGRPVPRTRFKAKAKPKSFFLFFLP